MKLPTGALFIMAWVCFQAQSQPLVFPADCNEMRIGKVAGVALDLLNKHRKEGYIFALVRVADAHEQTGKNASLIYLTLDVVETQCPVISRKHWSSCGHRRVLKITDLGQCKAMVYINEFAKKEKLYAYNCTISPVPPQLYECKRCLEKTTVLEDIDNYIEQANKILEKYSLRNNEANYFKVQKIQKVFGVHIRVLHHRIFIVEFTIKETECTRTTLPANVSNCEFLPDGAAHLGFCRGQTAKNSGVVEAYNCEIYDAHVRERVIKLPLEKYQQ